MQLMVNIQDPQAAGPPPGEALRRGVLDSLRSRLAVIDGCGVILAVNKHWREFGAAIASSSMTAAPDVGENYLHVLDSAADGPGGFARELSRGIRAVSARERRAFSMEYEVMVGASPRWYLGRVMPLEGSANDVVVYHRDITDEVIARLALERANKRMQALSRRILAVQEEERREISRELHDDVGQTLGALKIGLHRLARGPAEGQAGLVAECLAAADSALDRLRKLAHDLRPPQLEQLGLAEALGSLVERQRAATGLDIRFECPGGRELRCSASLEGACYRIVQEALNNAAKHAAASSIVVGLQSNGSLLKLSVSDDGKGFDEARARERVLMTGSIGLIGMHERAELAGGRLRIRSVIGAGTTISAVFPFRAAGVEPGGAADGTP